MNTIIGKDSVIEGTIEVQGVLRIDGVARGKISATESLAVGDSGQVEADLISSEVIIGGKVVGNVLAENKIELQSKAQMEGDMTTKNLIIEEGALFHGTCNMKGSSSDSALSKAQAAAQSPLPRA